MNQACLHQVITLDQSFSSDKTVKHSVSGDSIVTDFFILVVIKLGSQFTWVAFLFLWFWPYKVWARSSWSLFALHFLDWVFRCGKLLFYFLELLESPFVIFFVLDVGCSAATCREVGSLMYANFDSANMLLVLDDWIITLQLTWTPLSISLRSCRIGVL